MEDMVDVSSIFNQKKIFLTGHTGFKGSWMLALFQILGAKVKGYSLSPDNPKNLYNLIQGDNICESIIGDILDGDRLKKELVEFEPDYVFHLAAQPLVRLSYEIPKYTFDVNTIGTVNVLDALRDLNKPCVVVMITTDKVYHNREQNNYYYKETDRLGGFDPYSASKACAELVIDCYKNSYFPISKFQQHQKSIAIARAGNVIGGGDWATDRIIPDIVKALINNKTINIRNPNSIRPWQHVLEPLMGYLKLAAHQTIQPENFADAYNLGPLKNDIISVEDLVNIAVSKWGEGTYEVPDNTESLHEATLLQLDINKAITKLNWKPQLTSATAVDWTIDWYKHFNSNPNTIVDFTNNQIKKFLTLNS